MQIFNLWIVAALALAAGLVHATSAANGTDQLVISYSTAVGEYNLTVWIDAPGAAAIAPTASACGTNDVTCSTTFKADASICESLIGELNSLTTVANSPRAICLGQSGNQCCVSWSAAVGTIQEIDLLNAAVAVYNGCASGSISGFATNVNLNGHCVHECLSNRPNGC